MNRVLFAAILLTGCATPFAESPRAHCYQRPSGDRRCFATEHELSRDIAREQMATVRTLEERARDRALAVVAERDAKEAAARARATVERSDQIQEDAFGILVELKEDARERANPSEAPYPSPQTPPAP